MKPSQFNALLRQLPAAAANAATQRVAARRRTQYRTPLLTQEVATLERLGHTNAVYYSLQWDAANPFERGDDATYVADGIEHDALLAELRAYPQTPSIARLLYVVSNAVAS